jgi:hypothetical protein
MAARLCSPRDSDFPSNGREAARDQGLSTNRNPREQKFAQADALGFVCGPRSKLALVDVDSKDERVLAAALSTYGDTPVISRTPSGYHAWYRHNGERRSIRPLHDAPLDILGGGYAVVPPSRVAKGGYDFIQGGLNDLGGLPTMRRPPAPARGAALGETPAIHLGQRNTALWSHGKSYRPV